MSKLRPFAEISCNCPSNKNSQGEITYRQFNVQLKNARRTTVLVTIEVPSHVRIFVLTPIMIMISLMVALMVPSSRWNGTWWQNFLTPLLKPCTVTDSCLFHSFCADSYLCDRHDSYGTSGQMSEMPVHVWDTSSADRSKPGCIPLTFEDLG